MSLCSILIRILMCASLVLNGTGFASVPMPDHAGIGRADPHALHKAMEMASSASGDGHQHVAHRGQTASDCTKHRPSSACATADASDHGHGHGCCQSKACSCQCSQHIPAALMAAIPMRVVVHSNAHPALAQAHIPLPAVPPKRPPIA